MYEYENNVSPTPTTAAEYFWPRVSIPLAFPVYINKNEEFKCQFKLKKAFISNKEFINLK